MQKDFSLFLAAWAFPIVPNQLRVEGFDWHLNEGLPYGRSTTQICSEGKNRDNGAAGTQLKVERQIKTLLEDVATAHSRNGRSNQNGIGGTPRLCAEHLG